MKIKELLKILMYSSCILLSAMFFAGFLKTMYQNIKELYYND